MPRFGAFFVSIYAVKFPNLKSEGQLHYLKFNNKKIKRQKVFTTDNLTFIIDLDERDEVVGLELIEYSLKNKES